jgi:hypothetical protein
MQAGLTKRRLTFKGDLPASDASWLSERVTFPAFDHLGHVNETHMAQA